ncbi:MAG: hypothetical protein MJZ19_01255 [Paludibacteraceae bacterium]|nr:hypothetical protein [Paludibacteraceae bacterium]
MKKNILTILSCLASCFSMADNEIVVVYKDGGEHHFHVDNVKQIFLTQDTTEIDVSNWKGSVTGVISNYPYVDLGLPSGTLWAVYDVGAKAPSETGSRYAWGEVLPKDIYTSETYKWAEFDDCLLTKYCSNSKYGTVDSLFALQPEDDAATFNWGKDWRTPTSKEIDELIQGCKWECLRNPAGAYRGTSKVNGNVIYLPQTNYVGGTIQGHHWSSDLDSLNSNRAHLLYQNEYGWDAIVEEEFWDYFKNNCWERYEGRGVRAVVNRRSDEQQ